MPGLLSSLAAPPAVANGALSSRTRHHRAQNSRDKPRRAPRKPSVSIPAFRCIEDASTATQVRGIRTHRASAEPSRCCQQGPVLSPLSQGRSSDSTSECPLASALHQPVTRRPRSSLRSSKGSDTPSTNPYSESSSAAHPPVASGMGYSDGQGSGLKYVVSRFIWGGIIGAGAFSAILRGGWAFATMLGLLCTIGSWECFGLVRRSCDSRKLRAPSTAATAFCSLACGAMPLVTRWYAGQVHMALGAGLLAVGTVLLLQPTRPRLSEVLSLALTTLYCGFFSTFWVKLRLIAGLPLLAWPPLEASALQQFLHQWWPSVLGGGAEVLGGQWTLGLAATFLGFAGIIAADTGAYVGGKLLGRTPLTNVSPNKTWEGAISGLLACVAVSLWVANSLRWPTAPHWVAVSAALVFSAALFGDLVESVLKRDAGVKDAGRLIPGHGGVLDRTDSYVFTGMVFFLFVRHVLPRVAYGPVM